MRERETTTTTTGRRVTSDERDWETCVEPDCDNRVARFVLGDFYCRKHAPTSTGDVVTSTKVRWHLLRDGERTATFSEREDAGRAYVSLKKEFPDSEWMIDLEQEIGERA